MLEWNATYVKVYIEIDDNCVNHLPSLSLSWTPLPGKAAAKVGQ
jgi:hypothetical protein